MAEWAIVNTTPMYLISSNITVHQVEQLKMETEEYCMDEEEQAFLLWQVNELTHWRQ